MAWLASFRPATSEAASLEFALRPWECRAFVALACAACMLLLLPPTRFSFYPACPFHAFTGLLCPGCGGTRAIAAMLRGHFAQAFRLNALIVSLTPVAAIVAAGRLRRGIWPAVSNQVWITLVTATLIFTIVRNL